MYKFYLNPLEWFYNTTIKSTQEVVETTNQIIRSRLDKGYAIILMEFVSTLLWSLNISFYTSTIIGIPMCNDVLNQYGGVLALVFYIPYHIHHFSSYLETLLQTARNHYFWIMCNKSSCQMFWHNTTLSSIISDKYLLNRKNVHTYMMPLIVIALCIPYNNIKCNLCSQRTVIIKVLRWHRTLIHL